MMDGTHKSNPASRKGMYARWYQIMVAVAEHRATICPRWQSFEAFCTDVEPPPPGKNVLCLRDPAEPYGPGNVFWGTRLDRQQTIAHARVIEYRGKRLSISGWAREVGILRETLRKRLDRLPVSKALSPQRWTSRDAPRTKALNKSSRFVGVSRHSSGWEAKLRHHGRLHYIGLFPNERDAAHAVHRARLEIACEKQARGIRRAVARGTSRDQLLLRLKELIATTSYAVQAHSKWRRKRWDPARHSRREPIDLLRPKLPDWVRSTG